jgi:voltage-gated potassium channel
MTFLRQASAAAILTALTLSLQVAGMALLIHWARARLASNIQKLGPVRSAVLMVRFATAIIALHLSHIVLWTAFYHWQCFPSWETALYFSAASYTTVGYGDVVLSPRWRILGPVESGVGVLMSGLSVSVLFAIMTRLVQREVGADPVDSGEGNMTGARAGGGSA